MRKLIILLLSFFLILSIQLSKSYAVNKYNSIAYDDIVKYNNDNYTLIVKILKDTNKDNLIPYANLISLQTINFIPNDTQNKIAYTLSLPQQCSFIVIYRKDSENNYSFEGIIDNLSNIENFYYYEDFIVVEQSDSKPSTNFTQRDFLEIFYNKNNSYIPVFYKNIYMEKIIKNTTSKENEITKEIESSSIDYLEGDSPRILCVTSKTLYKGLFINLTNSYEFIENNKNTLKEIYEWCPTIECFKMKKEL